MIDYVGDVSRADAHLLAVLAMKADRILEFGSGASTQILAAYGLGSVHSVDTETRWIAKTLANLKRLGLGGVQFHSYEGFEPQGTFDLCFVDGLNELRLPFALKAWPALAVGGALCFHDTRRTEPYGKSPVSDTQMVCRVLERYFLEVASVEPNRDGSNITVITKRAPLVLEDYNRIECRTAAQLGLE